MSWRFCKLPLLDDADLQTSDVPLFSVGRSRELGDVGDVAPKSRSVAINRAPAFQAL
jgi:hypothetical protein